MTDGALPKDGNVRQITRWGEPVMHRRCKAVEVFDEELAGLVADMFATMYAANGVGLAANQIGVDLSLFVFSCPDDDDPAVLHEGVVCNPVLEPPDTKRRELDDSDEGCLSLPGAYAPCARPDWARVLGVDHQGTPLTYEGTGLLARCLQHETDHVHGTVFGDRLSKRWRKKLYREAERLADNYPEDWPITAATPADAQ